MIQLSKDYLMTMDHGLFTALGYCLQYNKIIFRGIKYYLFKVTLISFTSVFLKKMFL